jgi:hypothetical protein
MRASTVGAGMLTSFRLAMPPTWRSRAATRKFPYPASRQAEEIGA